MKNHQTCGFCPRVKQSLFVILLDLNSLYKLGVLLCANLEVYVLSVENTKTCDLAEK